MSASSETCLADAEIQPETREVRVDGSNELKKDVYFYFSFVTFKVENCLFRVPQQAFEKESKIFNDMFSLPRGDIDEVDGSSERHPLVLEGVNADDFRCLLRVLYPTSSLHNRELRMSTDDWIAVLRLSHMWSFRNIRSLAVMKLAKRPFDPVSRIELAHTFEISGWKRPSYKALVRRSEPLTLEEGNRLGMDFVIKLGKAREIVLRRLTNAGGPETLQQMTQLQRITIPSNQEVKDKKGSLEEIIDAALTLVFGLKDE